jgi:hypothetical protein
MWIVSNLYLTDMRMISHNVCSALILAGGGLVFLNIYVKFKGIQYVQRYDYIQIYD